MYYYYYSPNQLSCAPDAKSVTFSHFIQLSSSDQDSQSLPKTTCPHNQMVEWKIEAGEREESRRASRWHFYDLLWFLSLFLNILAWICLLSQYLCLNLSPIRQDETGGSRRASSNWLQLRRASRWNLVFCLFFLKPQFVSYQARWGGREGDGGGWAGCSRRGGLGEEAGRSGESQKEVTYYYTSHISERGDSLSSLQLCWTFTGGGFWELSSPQFLPWLW